MATSDKTRRIGNVRIVSRSSDPFEDRSQAGRLLAAELVQYKDKQPVVLGIPRGGIVVAREIAEALGGVLDVVLAHKLGSPGHSELALGSVSEGGKVFLNENVVNAVNASADYIEAEKARQLAQMRRRTQQIRKVRPKVSLKGRIAIVTDDGVATGATTQAAFWAVATEQPEKIVAAIPVGPEDTILRLAEFVDDMVCLRAPAMFYAVGQFYSRFNAVEDEDMLRILAADLRQKRQ